MIQKRQPMSRRGFSTHACSESSGRLIQEDHVYGYQATRLAAEGRISWLERNERLLTCSTNLWYYYVVSKKHRTTFEAIHSKPDRPDIDWNDFITLLASLGAVLKYQGGSAVGVKLNGIYAVFHKPHPGHTIYPTDLKRIRRFLQEAGITRVE